MDQNIPHLEGGTAGARIKLNAVIDTVNKGIRGDEQFIGVRDGPAGDVVFLNVAQLLARIPKFYDLPGFPALITGNNDIPGPYKYSFQKLIDVLRPFLSQQEPVPPGVIGDGEFIYATNGYDSDGVLGIEGNYNFPVPTNTVVWMHESFDEAVPPNPVYRFWYLDNTVGTFCDSPTVVYTDTPNVQATSYEEYDFELDFDFIVGLAGTRAKVSWGGLSAADYYNNPYCHIKVLKFDQITNPDPSFPPASTDMYANRTGYTTLPVIFSLGTFATTSPCDSCNPNNVNFLDIKGEVYMPPGGGSPAIYNDTTPLSPSGSYGLLQASFANRMVWVDETITTAHDTAKIQWNGFTATDCNGAAVANGLAVPTSDGFLGLSAGPGVAISDGGSSLLHFGLDLTSVGGSITITPSTCSLDFSVNFPSPGISGITGYDCYSGGLSDTFTQINSLSGIALTVAGGGEMGIGLRVTNGTYISWDLSGCAAIADVPPNTFDLYGAAASAQSASQAYTDTSIGALSGVYDPLGAAAAAENYSPGGGTTWNGSPPSTKDTATDRLNAWIAANFPLLTPP
jgi:hypothetical protein